MTAPSPKTATCPSESYRIPPTTFATMAAIPNADVWNSDCPVAWRSAGSRAAMVSTTATMTPAKPMPLNARVAMIASGTSDTAQAARHAA